MKKSSAAFLGLGFLFSAAASGAEDFLACTANKKPVTLSATISGKLKGDPPLDEVVRQAWKNTAASLYSDELGYAPDMFYFYLSEALADREILEDIELLDVIPPRITGWPRSCTP